MPAAKRLSPMAEANHISALLKFALGEDCFPVDVGSVAIEVSRHRFPDSPIAQVQGVDIGGFDGVLKANRDRSKWLIAYSNKVQSEGRKRYTISHEFGHYVLHRHLQYSFSCSASDIESGDHGQRNIEAEADRFACNLLMPLDDFRCQTEGEVIDFDLLGHCADRYGVSLTAAALRWIEIAPERAVLVASRDDHMLWAKSNDNAFKAGNFFATRKDTIELPQSALAHSALGSHNTRAQLSPAATWFMHEPDHVKVVEHVVNARSYDYQLTLLLMPDADSQYLQHDDGEPEEDTFDRFINNEQYPVR